MAREDGQFKPGQSGNPNGRPVGTRNRSTIVRKILEIKSDLPEEVYASLSKHFPGIEKNMSIEDVITLVMVNQARKGNVQAYKALMDSAYGTQIVDPTASTGTFEDVSAEELEAQFYLPPASEK